MRSNTLLVLVCALGSGCYQELYDAVVDPSSTAPGGAIATTLSGQALSTTTGLATSTATTPVEIDGRTADSTMIISLIAADDAIGRTAQVVLGETDSTIIVPIQATSVSTMQLHFLGSTCTATSGNITLNTDTNLLVTGTFDGTGTIGSGTEPCTLSGTITAIPQSR